MKTIKPFSYSDFIQIDVNGTIPEAPFRGLLINVGIFGGADTAVITYIDNYDNTKILNCRITRYNASPLTNNILLDISGKSITSFIRESTKSKFAAGEVYLTLLM